MQLFNTLQVLTLCYFSKKENLKQTDVHSVNSMKTCNCKTTKIAYVLIYLMKNLIFSFMHQFYSFLFAFIEPIYYYFKNKTMKVKMKKMHVCLTWICCIFLEWMLDWIFLSGCLMMFSSSFVGEKHFWNLYLFTPLKPIFY